MHHNNYEDGLGMAIQPSDGADFEIIGFGFHYHTSDDEEMCSFRVGFYITIVGLRIIIGKIRRYEY